MSVADSVTALILLILSLLYGICLMYYGYKFYQLRNEMIYIKRRGNIVTITAIASIIVQLFGYPLTLFLHWETPLKSNPKSVFFLVMDFVNDCLYSAPYYFGAFMILFRYWMIYYDIQFSYSCLNFAWKKCINNNIETLYKEMWYIEHRGTFGNESFMIKFVITIWIIFTMFLFTSAILLSLAIVKSDIIGHILSIVVFAIMFITLIKLWRKMPYFNDNIYLYREFQIISYFWIGLLLIYFIAISVRVIIGSMLVTKFIGHFAVETASFIIPFLSTFWVLKHFKEYNLIQNMQMISTQNQNNILRNVLKDNDTLNLFMQHLLKSFSGECLLSFIEFTQFRSYAITELNINETDIEYCVNISIADNVPQSHIVYGEHTSNDMLLSFKIKGLQLYNKYVKSGAEFEINLPYGTKCTLNEFFSNGNDYINELDLIKIFDEAIIEMKRLLNYSKRRFQYEKI
eukprot:418663_1